MITGKALVTSHFGYWPEFCDGKITHFSYERSGTVSLSIWYIDVDKRKAGEVSLRFSEVGDFNLTDLMSENVVDLLSIDGTGPFTVSLEACAGLGGQFTCQSVEVTALLPNNMFEADREA